jgi:hypothetical protein
MRPTRQLQSLLVAFPLLGAIGLLALSGCLSDSNKPSFYTYCDNTGCYQCDSQGCGRVQGVPPGSVCKANSDCAPGCFCSSNGQCAEGGFCDVPTDCSSGYTCDTPRHSCQPGPGTTGGTPQVCKLASDCAAGYECNNATCKPAPVLANHCIFNRECGGGGVCEDGFCQKACQANANCGTGYSCTGGRCVPTTGVASCTLNTDCGASQTCINSVCHLGCSKDGECQANNANDMCLSTVCRADGRRVPECKMNADCTAGRECENAQCRAFCFSSSDCALCTDGNVCNAGYCMTAREVNPQCQLGPDCSGGGLHCIDGACSQQ